MDISLVEFIVLALATSRIASLLAYESGPYDVFDRLRARVGVAYDEQSNQVGTNVFAKMLICTWCNSFWVGLVLVLCTVLPYWWVLVAPFALSEAAIIGETKWKS